MIFRKIFSYFSYAVRYLSNAEWVKLLWPLTAAVLVVAYGGRERSTGELVLWYAGGIAFFLFLSWEYFSELIYRERMWPHQLTTLGRVLLRLFPVEFKRWYVDRRLEAEAKELFEIRSRYSSAESKASPVLAVQFLAKTGMSVFPIAIGLFGFGVLALERNEVGAGVCCIVLAFVVAAHRVLTEMRVRCGYFGANADEAIELIEYLLKQRIDDDTPPPDRVSRPYRTQQLEEAALPGFVEGAR